MCVVYQEMVDPITNVPCSSLGIGATVTWHGYPDGWVRGESHSSTDIIYSSDEDEEDSDTCLTGFILNESQGDTACVEAKPHCSPHHFPQLVSTNIVASFIIHSFPIHLLFVHLQQ